MEIIWINSRVRDRNASRTCFHHAYVSPCDEEKGTRHVRDSSASRTWFYSANMDNMSDTDRSGKAVASSSRKRVRTGTTIPPAPAVPRGKTQR
ncbi:hypothetical protein KY285_030532 [Solanum tuberosum]|nr:hypothetical protein KY285_030532 [Solanum tuberosum]